MGYIEMGTLEDVTKACMLNGQKLCTKHHACNCSGFPIKVKRSEAEKNWTAMKEKAPPKIQPCSVYVCNLNPAITRRDIIDVCFDLFVDCSCLNPSVTWMVWIWKWTNATTSRDLVM